MVPAQPIMRDVLSGLRPEGFEVRSFLLYMLYMYVAPGAGCPMGDMRQRIRSLFFAKTDFGREPKASCGLRRHGDTSFVTPAACHLPLHKGGIKKEILQRIRASE